MSKSRIEGRGLSLLVLASVVCAGLLGGCRRYNPPPPPPGPNTDVGGMGGSTPGTGGRGGAGGSMPEVAPPVDSDAKPDPTPACGNPNQPCCPGNRCLNGGCCEQGMCTSHGDQCRLAPGHSCIASTCSVECGGPQPNGMPMKCCAQQNCTFPLTICDKVGVGACVGCGRNGQGCCADNYCEPGLSCSAGKCGSGDAAAPVDAPPTPTDATDAPRG